MQGREGGRQGDEYLCSPQSLSEHRRRQHCCLARCLFPRGSYAHCMQYYKYNEPAHAGEGGVTPHGRQRLRGRRFRGSFTRAVRVCVRQGRPFVVPSCLHVQRITNAVIIVPPLSVISAQA